MKKRNAKSVIIVVVSIVLMIALATSAYAAGLKKSITVNTGVSLYVDDRPFTPVDVNGNPVEIFIYNGTTYLPARAISSLFDTLIQWDGQTYSVYMGKHSSEKPAAYLEDLDYFTGGTLRTTANEDSVVDNTGVRRTHVIDNYSNYFSNVYYLNGNYSAITGTMFWPKEYNNFDGYSSTLRIYADDSMIYEGTIKGGQFPVDFNLDITGVLKLEVEWSGIGYGHLCEVALWS